MRLVWMDLLTAIPVASLSSYLGGEVGPARTWTTLLPSTGSCTPKQSLCGSHVPCKAASASVVWLHLVSGQPLRLGRSQLRTASRSSLSTSSAMEVSTHGLRCCGRGRSCEAVRNPIHHWLGHSQAWLMCSRASSWILLAMQTSNLSLASEVNCKAWPLFSVLWLLLIMMVPMRARKLRRIMEEEQCCKSSVLSRPSGPTCLQHLPRQSKV
mmetsp:Transcript_94763/g.245270  ORF Transcript_94763/g.245270 Transcript_94763/m.245270 type:complete len:211 (-) Transcript_94763:493-1125(-)